MSFYIISIETFSLFRTVFDIFDFNVFRVWPRPLTLRGHLRSKIFPLFGSPYMISYLTSVYILTLSRTVFEVFDFNVFRVWPWPLTFRGHLRSNIFSSFESPYMNFYLTSLYTFSLSRTVFEIFDIKVFRVWPWPLTFRGHLRSKIFSLFESPYMIFYLNFVYTLSLSHVAPSRKWYCECCCNLRRCTADFPFWSYPTCCVANLRAGPVGCISYNM